PQPHSPNCKDTTRHHQVRHSQTSTRRQVHAPPRHPRSPLQKRRRLLRALRLRHRRPDRHHRLHHRATQRCPPVPYRHRPQRRTHHRSRLHLCHPTRPATQVPPPRPL